MTAATRVLPLLMMSTVSSLEAAAVLTGSVDTSVGNAVVDLSAQGDLDWAIWNVTSPTGSPYGTGGKAATNTKNIATHLIGNVTAIGTNTTWRGSGSGSAGLKLFTYADGTSPASVAAAGVQQSPIFNSTLDSLNQGVQLTVTGIPGQLTTVYVWGTGFQGQGTLTASLAGATSLPLLSQSYASTKDATLFQINFTPVNVSDVLTLSYTLTSETASGNSHVGIQAVAVSAVPETSTGFLCLLGAGLVLSRRRK